MICATTRKKLLRFTMTGLALLAGVGIGVWAILSAMTASAEERKVPVYCVDRGDNKIALTFDCAWGNSNTEELLEILAAADARATFFVTGEFCDKYPEDVKKVYDAGHEIANHSDKHPHIEGININDLIEDTNECSRKIQMITGEAPALYRGPYGEYDNISISTVEGMGLQYVQWSVDSVDWQEPDAAAIVSRITEGTESGSILLFHNDLENTEQALPEILTKLTQQGYRFVTASELIYKDNYHIDSSGKQMLDLTVAEGAIKYSDNLYVNQALEIMRENLTMEEIYSLTQGADVQLIEKIRPMLNAAQLSAIQEMSYEELKDAVWSLVAVAEEQGAGGDVGGHAIEETAPEETSFAEELTEAATEEATTGPEFTTAETEAAAK